MTRILSDDDSRILTAPKSDPLEGGGGGGNCPKLLFLKFRRVTIRGAQPSARLSEEICLSEGSAGVSPRIPRGLPEGSAGLRGVLGGSARFSEGFRGY